MSKNVEFEKSLMKTIDGQIKQIFGETGASVIYNYMQSVLLLRQEEIPEKLEIFAEGLDKFLSSGAKVVEKVILDGLYSDFGQEFQFKEGYTFVDYINSLRSTLRKGNK